ncbi:hypothetical protein K9857_19015 [Pseudomonas sp. REP124]|uniref:hypothetical protein n=1 Tax=Pseudomonas sp. REP124 TaxID=2875731 RepID=UPI001CCB40C5|nr:hypothetical protein [Pseudomonas sp. REP124]MBZ9783625.1 hypothetical protein [Pseudomonas sp. REP124]
MELNLAQFLPPTVALSPRSELTTGRRYARVTHFPSRKNQAPIGCTALQHSDFCVHLEFDTRITRYASRPCRLEFKETGRIYRPDFCSIFNDARIVFYELCKPTSVIHPYEKRRLADLRRQFSEAGVFFELITLSEICEAQKTQNLRYLYHHALRGSPSGATAVRNTILSGEKPETSVHSLLTAGHPPEDIAYALFYQQVRANLDCRFSLETVVEAE